MGVREWTNKHPKVTSSVVGAFVFASAGMVVTTVMGNHHSITTEIAKEYFTVDDGKTFFAAGADNVPPFEHEGRTAVKANVFRCGGKKFVGYMERYTVDARKLELAGKAGPDTEAFGRELKKPGDAKWISSRNVMASSNIAVVACPPGMNGEVEPIDP